MINQQKVRDLLYPMEWIVRFIILAFLSLILFYEIFPENYWTLIFIFRALMIGALILCGVQIWYIWNFWKEKRDIT